MIDFSTAKSIVIPEGEAQSIKRGAEVLWQKQPDKYKTELAYIEGTGSQWLDTEYYPNNTTRVECGIHWVANTGDSFLYGSRKSYGGDAFGLHNSYAPFGSDYGAGFNGSCLFGNYHDVVHDVNGVFVDGVQQYREFPAQTFTSPVTFRIFRLAQSGGFYGSVGQAFKIHYFKIYDNGTIVRDFIPVLDWDDVPCMYDKVTDTLFYNQGTGEFLYE